VPAKKAPKKTAAKKKAAKQPAAKKSAGKKTAAKKATAKKAAPKNAAPRKKTPKKAAAKKATPKKTTPKKAAAKKAPARKWATKKVTPGKSAPKRAGRKKPLRTNSAELNDVSCQFASLALVQEKGPLSVRQGEQLRRALAIAGDALGWIENLSENGESVADFTRDMLAMAKNGAKSLGKGLAEQLAEKQTEIAQLDRVIEYARELAEDPDSVYPVDIMFDHTIRDAYQEYVTKTETRVANDADEARAAAAAVERSLTSWSKLAELMILELKRRQKETAKVVDSLPDFVASSRGVIGEVVANLE
jgi:hypothetical protein